METLANLESFVRSAELGGFSAAVSRNVAALETNLGIRLFQRSARKLTLTEAGERFLLAIGVDLESLQAAIVRELIRLIPQWHADAGPISLCYANRTLLPAKTRAFIDFIT